MVWEMWDHAENKTRQKPLLRQNLVDYFQELKKSLIYDPESGMMAIIREMERNIVASQKHH